MAFTCSILLPPESSGAAPRALPPRQDDPGAQKDYGEAELHSLNFLDLASGPMALGTPHNRSVSGVSRP